MLAAGLGAAVLLVSVVMGLGLGTAELAVASPPPIRD
jgi:hypothetical protein